MLGTLRSHIGGRSCGDILDTNLANQRHTSVTLPGETWPTIEIFEYSFDLIRYSIIG